MNIDKFKNAIGGGVRPSLFRIRGNIGSTTSPDSMSFLCTAASLPASTLGTIDVNYRGRTLTLPGSRTFDSWDITILNDEGMALRTAFENWLNDLNDSVANVSESPISLSNAVDFPNWAVDQLDRNGNPIKSYELFYCFPTSVAAQELSADADGLSSFSVTLQYQYHLASGVNGIAVGQAPARGANL